MSIFFCLSVYPSIRLFVNSSISLSVYPYIRISVYPSIRISVYSSIRFSVCLIYLETKVRESTTREEVRKYSRMVEMYINMSLVSIVPMYR